MENLPEQIVAQITLLSEKLKTPAEQLLTYAINGIRIEGIVGSLISLFFIIMGIYLFNKLFRYLKDGDHFDEPQSVGLVVFAVPVIGIISLYPNLIQAFAPQYWIIKKLLNLQ